MRVCMCVCVCVCKLSGKHKVSNQHISESQKVYK